MRPVWNWDQGRLEYFQFDALQNHRPVRVRPTISWGRPGKASIVRPD